MNITMIGTGYVGLVSGAGLADFGMQVICVDKDAERISLLEKVSFPFMSRASRNSLVAMSKTDDFVSAPTLLKPSGNRS